MNSVQVKLRAKLIYRLFNVSVNISRFRASIDKMISELMT
jgi:hypothetical protein